MILATFLATLLGLSRLSTQSHQSQKVDCSQPTGLALHSKSCPDALLEEDAGRIEDVAIAHKPIYHTYSRWSIDGLRYILAYWDRDNEVLNLAVDVYREDVAASGRLSYARIATVPVFEQAERVFTQDLIGDGDQQLIVLSVMGQLEAIRILQINRRAVRVVLDTAGTRVRVGNKPGSAIEVYGKSANSTEIFRWLPQQKVFRKTGVRSGPLTVDAAP